MDQRVSIGRLNAAASLIFGLATLPAGPAWAAKAAGNSAPLAAPALAVPVSILDLMRASVEIPADGIWATQGAEKPGDDDWLLADEDSVSLAGAAAHFQAGYGEERSQVGGQCGLANLGPRHAGDGIEDSGRR